jgi:hypothetical protein
VLFACDEVFELRDILLCVDLVRDNVGFVKGKRIFKANPSIRSDIMKNNPARHGTDLTNHNSITQQARANMAPVPRSREDG